MGFGAKKGQLTIFIILAIVIAAGITGVFVYKNYFSGISVPKGAQPVYDLYLSCISQLTEEGAILIGSKGGYMEAPDFEPGSTYMPSSSQLDFLGTPVPYWFYVSGNNIAREKVPTKKNMEAELEGYIEERLQNCDFDDMEKGGYLVDVERGGVSVKIEKEQIVVSVKNELRVSFEESFYTFSEHKVTVRSKLGKFYDIALEIYNTQKKSLFLENYALDSLSLNAPMSGFEEGCTPIVFNFAEIRKNISEALRENIAFVKVKGSYYSDADDYYVVDHGLSVDEDVNFIYSSQWPTKIEIYGEEFAEPVGLQEGMAMLGFCFVDYSLVYDVVFPVLIQIHDEREIFQFPVIALIERNQIREPGPAGEFFEQEDVICKNKNQLVEITTSDLGGSSVPATLSFSCLGERCYLGETKNSGGKAYLKTTVPRCVNGFIESRADGYSNGRYIISSNEENSAEVTMKKIYSVRLDLGALPGEALVQFVSDDFSRSVVYPSNKEVQLVEGVYNLKVQVYKNSSVSFPARTEQKCFEALSSGISGLIGGTEAKCYEVTIPSQEIDRVLVGGGSSEFFVSEGNLKDSSKISINVPLFGTPSKIEEINENYIKLEDSFVSASFVK